MVCPRRSPGYQSGTRANRQVQFSRPTVTRAHGPGHADNRHPAFAGRVRRARSSLQRRVPRGANGDIRLPRQGGPTVSVCLSRRPFPGQFPSPVNHSLFPFARVFGKLAENLPRGNWFFPCIVPQKQARASLPRLLFTRSGRFAGPAAKCLPPPPAASRGKDLPDKSDGGEPEPSKIMVSQERRIGRRDLPPGPKNKAERGCK